MSRLVDCMACLALLEEPARDGTITEDGVTHAAERSGSSFVAPRCVFNREGFPDTFRWYDKVIETDDPRYAP